MNRHTVILGAGATIAAIPNGDKNGRKSSVMNGLIENLNLQEVLDGIELRTQSNNLEDMMSVSFSATSGEVFNFCTKNWYTGSRVQLS